VSSGVVAQQVIILASVVNLELIGDCAYDFRQAALDGIQLDCRDAAIYWFVFGPCAWIARLSPGKRGENQDHGYENDFSHGRHL